MTKYEQNIAHVAMVREYMMKSVANLQDRLLHHDDSKFEEPERSAFEGLNEAIAGIPFGSEEYRVAIKAHLGGALTHHYENNRHHPNFYENGVEGMSLFDLIEFLCDIRAACDEKRKAVIDLEANQKFHNISESITQILRNTIREMNW
jgi:hypothetical protein